jgi:CHASE3 domain sensor protein
LRATTGLRRRAAVTSVIALVLAVTSLSVALIAADSMRAQGAQLSARLVPAAAATGELMDLYQAQQTWLRQYVTNGSPGPLTPFDQATGQAQAEQDKIGYAARGYPAIARELAATVTAYQAWRQSVADLQLAAINRGDAATARALQADTDYVRPYVLGIRSAGLALSAQITAGQQDATARLNSWQNVLLAALIAMCVVVAATAADATTAVWLGLLRPFRTLRRAVDSVAAGEYGTHIPAVGRARRPGPRCRADADPAGGGAGRTAAGRAAVPAPVRLCARRDDRRDRGRVDRHGQHPGRADLRLSARRPDRASSRGTGA